jgi:PAS domain S-box-containing protein
MGYALSYLYFAGFVALVVIATAAAMTMPPQPAKRWAVSSLALCAIWSFADFASNLATTAIELEVLAQVFSPAWALLPFATLQAAAHYAGAARWVRPGAKIALALPGAACVWLMLTHQLIPSWTPASETGGFFVVTTTAWQLPVNLYFIAYFGLGATLLFSAARRSGLDAFRRPANVFAFVFGPAALVAGGFEGVMASLGHPSPHVVSTVVAIVAIVVGVRLLRNEFFLPLTRLRRWAEDAVRASDDRYRMLLETSPDAVGLAEEHGRFINVNTSTARMLGFDDAQQLMDARPIIWESMVDADRPAALKAAVDAARTGTACRVEITGVRRDGTLIPLEVSVGALSVHAGAGRTFVYAARDVSERIRAAEEKQQLTEQVLRAQNLESLGLLAAGIAHDFNNVLLAVLGNAGIAKRRLPDDSLARPFVEIIEQAAHNGALLTRQLLTYAGRSKRTLEPVDLSTFTRDMTEVIRVSIGTNVQIGLSLDDDLPLVDADVGQVQQVVMNLLTNAAEAIGDRPGRISIRTSCVNLASGELQDHTGASVEAGRYVRIEVTDTGVGIAREDLHRIFDPFFTTKRSGQGLGLAAVLGIVQAHGGALTLHSDPNVGTRFGILLPVTDVLRRTEAPACVPSCRI